MRTRYVSYKVYMPSTRTCTVYMFSTRLTCTCTCIHVQGIHVLSLFYKFYSTCTCTYIVYMCLIIVLAVNNHNHAVVLLVMLHTNSIRASVFRQELTPLTLIHSFRSSIASPTWFILPNLELIVAIPSRCWV